MFKQTHWIWICFCFVLSLHASEGAWFHFCSKFSDKEPAQAPWSELTAWVDDPSVTTGDLEQSLQEGTPAVKVFSAAMLLRRGFEEKPLSVCEQELTSFEPTFLRVFTAYGAGASVAKLEQLLTNETSRDQGLLVAPGLWNHHASEKARGWLLDHYDLNQPLEALILARAGLIEETRHVLEKIKDYPTPQGEEASRLLREHLSLMKFGGPVERQLKEYQVLYQEARAVVQDFLKEHRNFQFNQQGRQLLQRAYNLLQREKRYRDSFSKAYQNFSAGELLLWEMLLDIQEYYVDDNRIDSMRLFQAAANGIAAALDRHCSYMGPEETRRSEERFSGNYVGIGAVVTKSPTGTVLIESVFFGAPAWKSGIRSGDQITEVAGQSTVGLTLNEAVQKLRGEPGTSIAVQVLRAGWDKPVENSIVRESINTPSLFVELLPGNIVYAKLTQFIATSDRDLIREISTLQEELKSKDQTMSGLILDLRDNGGGYLHTAVNICDQFLPSNKLIVYSQGRNPQIASRQEQRSTGRGRFKDLPLVILVNKGSASASEIVSGCMRDHQRAIVVGERTFGKGSVQNLMTLDSMKGDARLRLTIAYYYLPSGESIHRRPGNLGGVKPNVEVKTPQESSDVVKELIRLQNQKAYDKYINENLRDNKDLLIKLGTEVAPDAAQYPNFEPWYQSLETSLTQQEVCKYLRYRVRSRASEELGEFLIADWYSDPQLQAAMKELAKKAGFLLAEIPAYGILR